MKGITSIGHTAIKVKDLEKSLHYYKDLLEFPEMLRLHHPDGSVWLVYLRITDEQFLEVFPGAENERAPGWNANGPNHLCFTVDDVDAVTARMKANGIEMLMPPKDGADGNRQAWIEDPDGNRMELMQMRPDCLQAKAIERLKAERAKAHA